MSKKVRVHPLGPAHAKHASNEIEGTNYIAAANLNTDDGMRSPRHASINIVDMMEPDNEEGSHVPLFINNLDIGPNDML
jgi:hypothetical protein